MSETMATDEIRTVETRSRTIADAPTASDAVVVDADLCRAARGFANWTAPKLSREAGVPVSDVGALESGKTPSRFDTPARIRKAFEKVGIVFVPASAGGPGILRPVGRC